MEFLKKNFYDTTTQIAVTSNTITAGFLIDGDTTRQWSSSGYADDSVTAQVVISFDETVSVDRIILRGMNVKEFNIFYNGLTANAFVITGPTTTSQFNANASENLYLSATPAYCTSVTFDFKKTMVANSEKAIGQIILTQNEYTFPRIPAANNYTPTLNPKQNLHELSSGGTRSHVIDQKWETKIKLQYIPSSFVDSLRAIYDQHEEKIFVPFGTTTSWDGVAYQCNWVGTFDFYKFADNALASGYIGNIDLKEA